MTNALVPRVQRGMRPFGVVASLVFALALVFAGCRAQFIADYDEFTVDKTTQLQEQCEELCVSLEEAANTPDEADDLYPAHLEEYEAIEVSLRLLESRVGMLRKNEITQEQVELLRKSYEAIRNVHRERSAATPPKGLSAATVQTLREPLMSQFRSILVLQEALKRETK